MKMVLPALVIALTLVLPVYANETKRVEVDGYADLAGSITAEQARENAKNDARRRAVEKVTGVVLTDTTYLVSNEVARKLFRETKASVRGKVIDEEFVWKEPELLKGDPGGPPVIRYKVRLNAAVAVEEPGDPDFNVSLKLNKRSLSAGEPLRLTVESSRNAHLLVFNLAADDRVYVLYPNPHRTDLVIGKDVGLELPSAKDGFELRPYPLKAHSMDTEALKVVATVKPVRPPGVDARTNSLSVAEFYRWLLTIPARERAEDTQVYTVHQ